MEQVYALLFSDWNDWLINIGEPEYRADQIWKGLYKHYYTNWNTFSNIPKTLREMLSKSFYFPKLENKKQLASKNKKTIKYGFILEDNNYIESVLLETKNRFTLCISTQSGCPAGCKFCATGGMGFHRNLTSSEMIAQVIFAAKLLSKVDQSLTNIVLMGMGEPFLNYQSVINAVYKLNDQAGMGFGARRITISTIGIVEKIIAFAEIESQFNLAISLHAPYEHLRRSLIPIAEKYHLEDLMDAARFYVSKTNRRITYEYVMIAGINDKQEHAFSLANLLRGQNCHVNLIPLNPNPLYVGQPTPDHAIKRFGKYLLEKNIPTTIRNSQGANIQAGCGQLAETL